MPSRLGARLARSSASHLAFAACSADLGVGDLVGQQGIDLGGLGGGVAEAAADDLDGDAAETRWRGRGGAGGCRSRCRRRRSTSWGTGKISPKPAVGDVLPAQQGCK